MKGRLTEKGSCFCSIARAVEASCHSLVIVLGFGEPAMRRMKSERIDSMVMATGQGDVGMP